MERKTSVEKAQILFGKNFIGKEEINSITKFAKLYVSEYKENMISLQDDIDVKNSILIYGKGLDINGNLYNIKNMLSIFGKEPDKNEPCFYNQDWYLKEDFIHKSLDEKWYIVKKNVCHTKKMLKDVKNLPSTILLTYVFFINFLVNSEVLWEDDFIWTSDVDHNGDRIYCGRYFDIESFNKNGFNIHRHLKIKNNFGYV